VTEQIRIESEVQGVGTAVYLQEAILQEVRSGISVLQAQDNQIVQEASSLFDRIRSEMTNMSKRISDNSLQILAVKNSNQNIQKNIVSLTKKLDEVNRVMAAITDSLKDIPSKKEMRQHAQRMEDQVAQIAEINTALTTAMEGYKVSESTPQNPL